MLNEVRCFYKLVSVFPYFSHSLRYNFLSFFLFLSFIISLTNKYSRFSYQRIKLVSALGICKRSIFPFQVVYVPFHNITSLPECVRQVCMGYLYYCCVLSPKHMQLVKIP